MEDLIKGINFSNIYTFFKGRVALYAILKAIGIKKGDEVVLPGFTCVVVPNAIVYLGGKPVYVDIDASTYNIDPALIENKITPKTKAIIAQHTFGIPAEMDKIIAVAKKHNLFVIEDACHTLGSSYMGRVTGSFGDAAFFSSQWSKPVTTGLGGWAVVNNPDLKKRFDEIYSEFEAPKWHEGLLLWLQFLVYKHVMSPELFWLVRSFYRSLSKLGIVIGSSTQEELDNKMPNDYLKKMSLWQTRALKRAFEKAEHLIKHRRWVVSLYEKILPEIGIKTVELSEKYGPVYLRYPIIVKNKETLLEEARKNRVEIGDWFVSPVHPNEDGWRNVYYEKGMCPVAEDVCKHIVNLPTYEKIKEKQIDAIKKVLLLTEK